MPEYELTPGGEADLKAIARYTINTWGMDQARRYQVRLEEHFAAIGQGTVRSRIFRQHRPDIRFSRCARHYIFYRVRENRCPLIIAVFHTSMDLMTRLRERLEIE